MKITRRFTHAGQDPFASVTYERRTSRISNPDGSVVFEMNDAEIPAQWSQLATDIMVSKYFRKAGVPQTGDDGQILRDASGTIVTGPEKSARQVIHRLAGCWRYWGEKYGYFDTAEDAQAFYDELAYMLLHQMCAPNSPQWFNTGLNFAYGITGPAQGHYFIDPKSGELQKSRDAYSHPQPHACQPYRAPISTPHGNIAIGKIVSEKLVGLEVYDGSDRGAGTTRVVAVKFNGSKAVLRIVLEDGGVVEATGDHLVYVKDSDGLSGRWVRVDALEAGMRMVRVVRDRAAEELAAQQRSQEQSGKDTAVTIRIRVHKEIAIKRIDAAGVQPVYDIQTESGQYLCDHILVHNCFIQSVSDDLVNSGGIMDLWTREARLFKYGSGTGSNFSRLRGENEPLSGGGKSSGLMSFLRIGDRAAGAIKSGGTTRRAAKMVCLDLDHPDVEHFINWKVREELKVAAMVEGIKHLSKEQQEQARKLGLKLDYDFNGEAYYTVSGQNSNNSVRIPNRFFKALEEDGDWTLTWRTNSKPAKTLKARELWEQIAFAAWRCADPGVQYDDTINQWHTCPQSGPIRASNPCVTGDTRVLTPGGIWRRIDQMIHLPTRVVTNLHGQEIHVTDGAFPTGTQDVFELKTAGGYCLKLTADHKVWTRGRGWVQARDLTTDDEVRLPSKPACVHEIGEPQDTQFFQLLGLFLSDVNGDPGALRLDACLKDAGQVDDFARYVADHWGDRLYADDYVNRSMVDADAQEDGNTLTATLTNRRLLSRLKAFIRTDHGMKRLSDEAFTSGLAAQRHLLRALFTADARIINGSVELLSSSDGLLEDVQLILLGLGIKSSGCSEGSNLKSQISNPQSEMGDGGAIARGGLPDRPASCDAPADFRRHGLRIDPGSLRSFGKYVGLLPGQKLEQLVTAISYAISVNEAHGNYDRVAGLAPLGRTQVFDLTESHTQSFVANGLTVHNCSEYMFLDDTACNLASLNVLTFFDPEARRFDVEGYKHGVRLWTIVLEVSVLMASFPSEAIARLSYEFRTLGLGYANLGAMLMQAGIPYDSDKGRAICGGLTAILTGESYATSAEIARELGAFPGYERNKNDMLRVIRNHRRAAYDVAHNSQARKGAGAYERLDIEPVGIDATQFADNDPMAPRSLLASARECWDRALLLGERHGYRNAQTTVIAPTGCLVGRSLVSTDRGLMRLDHLGDVNGTRWQDVSFSVLTDQGERRATKFFVNGVEQTRRIITSCGYSIDGTLKHRIKVINPETGEWAWKHFADLAPGEIVPLAMSQSVGQPRPVDLPPLGELYWTTDYTTRVPRTVTPELAEFVGYFMGDGSHHAKGLRLCVTNGDDDVLERLKILSKQLFNIDAITSAKEGYVEVSVHSVALTLWWEACGFTKLPPSPDHTGKGYRPRIPAAILASNDSQAYAAFLRGLFEADGCVIAGTPHWCTAHGEFAEEVKTLLLSLGFPTTTKHDISGWGAGTLYVLRLRNQSYVCAFGEKVRFIGRRKQNLLRSETYEQAARYDYVFLPPEIIEELVPAGAPLENAVTLSRKRHAGGLTRRSVELLFQQTQDPRLAHALSFFYDRIEANEDAGEQMTYDLSVPENVTYVANGFVSHNTIGLLMDCDTTGVEPDFALVKFKKLAGGGYFKIANQSLRPALVNLGYEPSQIHDILQYVMGTLTLHDAPHISYERLERLGFTREELDKIEAALPGTFEISFAFSPWTLGASVMRRFDVPEQEWQQPSFNLLRRLGFTKKQIDEANDVICGRGTVEGAPHLKDEHLPVFDCANKCGKTGKRFIAVEGHIRMMAAAQPFISGAISKTINLPNEATLEDIENSYLLSWKLGLKANALYRDGSKLSQPLNIKSDEDLDKTDEEDEDAVAAAKDEVATDVARAAAAVSHADSAFSNQHSAISSDNLAPAHTNIIEKIVERIVERPLRRRLPDTRHAMTHKFDVAGHEGYITVGLYEDGQPGEVFIRIAKEGSTIGGLMDTIATLVSVSLQYGVPVESLVRKFEHVRFEPSGMTRNPEIPIAKSLTDYIFRWMAMEFVPGYRAAHAPKRDRKGRGDAGPALSDFEGTRGRGEDSADGSGLGLQDSDEGPELPPTNPGDSALSTQHSPLGGPAPSTKKGNGHGPRLDPDTARPFAYTDAELKDAHSAHLQAPEVGAPTPSGANLRLAIVADPLSQQGANLQADAPACDVCGSITVRSGTCYKCLNCGNSMGCS